MTPDWKRAMEREADSVNDPVWAAQTRRAALWASVRGLPADALLSLLGMLLPGVALWGAWIALVNCSLHLRPTPVGCWLKDRPQALDPVLVLSLLTVMLVLGLIGVRRRVGVAVSALLPLSLLVVAGTIDALGWQPHIVLSDGRPLRVLDSFSMHGSQFTVIGGVLFAFLGLSLGRWLRARWGRRA